MKRTGLLILFLAVLWGATQSVPIDRAQGIEDPPQVRPTPAQDYREHLHTMPEVMPTPTRDPDERILIRAGYLSDPNTGMRYLYRDTGDRRWMLWAAEYQTGEPSCEMVKYGGSE